MTLKTRMVWSLALAAGVLPLVGRADVLPATGHAGFTCVPFGAGPGRCVIHQVFFASLFSAATGGQPALISRLAFAPYAAGTQSLGHTTVRLGYTRRVPCAFEPDGLSVPDAAGGGAPNAAGPVSVFYDNPALEVTSAGGANTFDMVLEGAPFFYDPSLGNLLVEVVSDATSSVAVSRGRFNNVAAASQALRIDFTFSAVTGPTGACCMPDGSCTETFPGMCAQLGGVYRGDQTPCAAANCPQPPTGAC
jgi:hypothetical protein